MKGRRRCGRPEVPREMLVSFTRRALERGVAVMVAKRVWEELGEVSAKADVWFVGVST